MTAWRRSSRRWIAARNCRVPSIVSASGTAPSICTMLRTPGMETVSAAVTMFARRGNASSVGMKASASVFVWLP